LSALFAPINLRESALPNRVMVAPMCQYSAVDGEANDWHFTHINTLALSGAAIFCIDATAVAAAGRADLLRGGISSGSHRPHHAGLSRAVERRHRTSAAADRGLGAQTFQNR